MGLVLDVKHEVAHLDVSEKSLRKFGLMVGGVFLLLALIALRKKWDPSLLLSFLAAGSALALLGAALPTLLRVVYRVWMGLSLCIGWCMSRILLTILFCLAIVPIALLGRVLHLPFMKIRQAPKRDSYWEDHKPRSAKHFEEMF
ncbi:MAG: hypothetical protein K8R87_13240 [Verrucomicrobia bacterium]|nr:hypothetical protein [Verrucomicrobiota bacterium]